MDLTAASRRRRWPRLRRGLLAAGFGVVREHGAALPSGPCFVRFAAAEGVVLLEVQAAKTGLQRELVRAVATAAGLRVATVEDLIVLKLIADRPKDQGALRGLARRAGVDWPYVECWAAEWGLSERLAQLRRQC